MQRCMMIGVWALFLAASVAAQDAVEIKITKPKVGERVKQTREETYDSQFKITIGGEEKQKNEKATKSVVYIEEVLAVEDGSDRPTKAKRTYEKAKTSDDDKETTLDIEGKTVLIEKKGEKFVFTVDGKDVDADSQKFLDTEYNKPNKEDPRDMMLPKKPLKPGDSWKIEADPLVKSIAKSSNMTLDKDMMEANGKLVKAYKVGDKQFGVIDLKITAPVASLGKVKVKDGTMTITMNGDGCVDGSSAEGKSTMTMKLTVAGSGEGFELKGEVNAKETRTTVPAPKK